MTIILGIDPGSIITGYGVIKLDGNRISYLGCGLIKIPKESFDKRLKVIYQALEQVIERYKPDVCAVEQVFMSVNAGGAIKLGMARGVAIVAAANANIPVFEYSARQVKSQSTGTGAATKKQVQLAVVRKLCLNKIPPEDAADGLAVALTHAHSLNIRGMITGGALSNQDSQHQIKFRNNRFRLNNSQASALAKLLNARNKKKHSSKILKDYHK